MTHRKLALAKSVLLAVADRLMHGTVIRSDLRFPAKHTSRCDDCGLTVRPGDEITNAHRPGLQPLLFVHVECPSGDVLFTLIPWLSKWEGADIISAQFPAVNDQRCRRCVDRVFEGEIIALVRRPGPMRYGLKHSDYVHERCVKK